jgi:hypothetical protein
LESVGIYFINFTYSVQYHDFGTGSSSRSRIVSLLATRCGIRPCPERKTLFGTARRYCCNNGDNVSIADAGLASGRCWHATNPPTRCHRQVAIPLSFRLSFARWGSTSLRIDCCRVLGQPDAASRGEIEVTLSALLVVDASKMAPALWLSV